MPTRKLSNEGILKPKPTVFLATSIDQLLKTLPEQLSFTTLIGSSHIPHLQRWLNRLFIRTSNQQAELTHCLLWFGRSVNLTHEEWDGHFSSSAGEALVQLEINIPGVRCTQGANPDTFRLGGIIFVRNKDDTVGIEPFGQVLAGRAGYRSFDSWGEFDCVCV